MAKRLYEEEGIKDIARKIRQLVPLLSGKEIFPKDMPAAVERVYEEGKIRGRGEGYGNGYNQGYREGNKSGKETGYDLGHEAGYIKGYHSGAEALKSEEARTSDDLTVDGATVTAPSGYYAEEAKKTVDTEPFYTEGYQEGQTQGYNNGYSAGHTEGYNEGYTQGKSEGVELPTLTNPGTAGDMLAGKELIDGNGNVVTGTIPTRTSAYISLGEIDVSEKYFSITVPAGYYPQDTGRGCSLSEFYDTAYNEGYNVGYDTGHTEGWHKGYDVGIAAGGGGGGSGIQLGEYLFDICSTVGSGVVNVQAFNYNTNYYLHLYICVASAYSGNNPLEDAIDIWEVEAVIEPDGEWYWDSAENGYVPTGPNMDFAVYVTNIAFSENGEL